MNIKQVSLGLLGIAMIAGYCSSCTNSKYKDKAKAQAVKYMNADQLLKAERYALQQKDYEKYNGEAIEYWDSLLIEAKTKEAYAKGQQLIRDRENKIFKREEKFKVPIDTIINEPDNLLKNIKNEYAKYTDAENFIKARDKAPEDFRVGFGFSNDKAASTHYWNLITMANKQREAYEKGMTDERTNLLKSNNESVINNIVNKVINNANKQDRIETNIRYNAIINLSK